MIYVLKPRPQELSAINKDAATGRYTHSLSIEEFSCGAPGCGFVLARWKYLDDGFTAAFMDWPREGEAQLPRGYSWRDGVWLPSPALIKAVERGAKARFVGKGGATGGSTGPIVCARCSQRNVWTVNDQRRP